MLPDECAVLVTVHVKALQHKEGNFLGLYIFPFLDFMPKTFGDKALGLP